MVGGFVCNAGSSSHVSPSVTKEEVKKTNIVTAATSVSSIVANGTQEAAHLSDSSTSKSTKVSPLAMGASRMTPSWAGIATGPTFISAYMTRGESSKTLEHDGIVVRATSITY